MNIPYVMKKCSKCGRWLVANTVNFYKAKAGKYALATQCKECRNKKNKQWYEANKDKIAKQHKQYYENNKDKTAEYNKQYREANKEKIAEQRKQYYQDNKEKIAERNKQYCQNNKEKIAEKNKRWYEANREKIDEYREDNKEKIAEQKKQWYEANKEKEHERQKRYREANKEKIAEYNKQYRQSPQGQVVSFNRQQRRRIKEEQQGDGITKDQWQEMMSFFDWKCAYSGETLSKDNRSIDHIVPLNSNGDNMIWNMVPMLRSLNSSKNTKDMLEWYKQQSFFSKSRLAKIYKWQEYAYNKYGKDSEYFNTNDIQITLL